jgi:hypothetical protein
MLPLTVSIHGGVVLRQEQRLTPEGRFETTHMLAHQLSAPAMWKDVRAAATQDVYQVLSRADGKTSLGELLRQAAVSDEERQRRVVEDVEALWARRYLTLQPAR